MINIILVDDHTVIREGLRSLLKEHADMHVVAESGDGRTAIELVKKHSPDIVVMDISIPGLNGIEATRRITRWNSRIKVVALSMYENRRLVLRMFEAGASAYLLKECAFEELVNAIRIVLTNKSYLSPAIATDVIKDFVHYSSKNKSSVLSALTPKECEILQLLAEGNPTKQIACTMGTSIKTVETHRQHIMDKLDIHSIAGLTKYAIREKLTSLEI